MAKRASPGYHKRPFTRRRNDVLNNPRLLTDCRPAVAKKRLERKGKATPIHLQIIVLHQSFFPSVADLSVHSLVSLLWLQEREVWDAILKLRDEGRSDSPRAEGGKRFGSEQENYMVHVEIKGAATLLY